MSETTNPTDPTNSTRSETPPKARRSVPVRLVRGVAWLFLSLLLLVSVALVGLAWYSTTPDFQRRVGKEVVSVLEDATGGKVDLAKISFDLRHLAIEADGLVIHGLEGPGEAPYLSADRILLRLRIVSLFTRMAGGAASHVGLNYLRVDHPQVHLIIDKDGKTNQPVPKHPSTSTTPVQNTLLDLKAKQVELANGVVLVNDRAIPFDVAARDLEAEVRYLSATDRYGATIDLNDLRTKMAKEPEAQSKLHLEAQLGRDMAQLTKFDLHTGAMSDLHASGELQHFAKPEWQGSVNGLLELKQIAVLGGVDGLNAGTLELKIDGHNCETAPVEAQKHPRFWQRRHPKAEEKPSTKVLAPDPDCKAGYLVVGNVKLHNAGYRDATVRLHDINGGAQLHITPTELLFTALTGYLPGGGSAAGELRISNWLGEVPASAPATSATTVAAAKTANTTAKSVGAAAPVDSVSITPVERAHAYLNVTIDRIPLRTIMDIAGPKGYGDLGFDTSVSGPLKVEWGGPATLIADSVIADGDLKFTPTGVRRRGALRNIPVSGEAVVHYRGQTQVVNLERVVLRTPESTVDAKGVLGVNKGDRLTNLELNASFRDLGEYDQLLQTLGFSANGKKGSAAIPVVLHGTAQFQGTARGAIADLDVKGHLQAENVAVQMGTQADVQIDSVIADAEYAPKTGLAVASSTIKRSSAVLNLEGSLKPRRVVSRRGVATFVYDDGSTVDAKVQLNNANIVDVLQIAGQAGKYPVTGTVSVNGHAGGTIKNLSGGGELSLVNGVAYGEGYDSAVVDLTVAGKDIEASNIVLKLHGMQIAGNGGYDTGTERLHAHIAGSNLVLSKFDTVKKANLPADGTLSLTADASGTVTEPGLKANLTLANLTYGGQALGQLTADVHSQGSEVFYTANSTVAGAGINAQGQTSLVGGYETQAKLTLTGLDVAKVLPIVSPNNTIKASSSINGVVQVSGPMKTPAALNGTAELNPIDFTLQGIQLKGQGPLRASLRNGTVTLDQLHITGQDTDLQASGTAQVLGVTDPKGGVLDIKSTGSLNMALLHTFAPDVTSSGKVEFQIAAGGRVQNPALTGKVMIEKVNLAMDGIPNGLTNLNGTMVFNEDRLIIQDVSATTGGGQLKLGGFLTYKGGVFADVTATATAVRVRYAGLSGTTNTTLKLQGSADTMRLSGTVLLTRFGVGADVDFAQFAGSGGVSAPPDPSSPTAKILLDVHVTSSPQLDFQNSYAKLAGTVDLNVRGTLAEPTVLGRIQITEGDATFAGTKYQLQRGDIYFSNPVRIDPIIDIDAVARVENYDITIGVHGTTTSLKPTYRSEPPLSEADIFNLLALGRTQEEAQLYSEQQTQAGTDPATSALLGGALNATVSNRVSKLFGGGSVKIDPAFVGTLGQSSARITVQQQLSRQISVVFATNVNTSAQQLIQVNYALNENQSIVATRDETGVFSIVYKLRKRYR